MPGAEAGNIERVINEAIADGGYLDRIVVPINALTGTNWTLATATGHFAGLRVFRKTNTSTTDAFVVPIELPNFCFSNPYLNLIITAVEDGAEDGTANLLCTQFDLVPGFGTYGGVAPAMYSSTTDIGGSATALNWADSDTATVAETFAAVRAYSFPIIPAVPTTTTPFTAAFKAAWQKRYLCPHTLVGAAQFVASAGVLNNQITILNATIEYRRHFGYTKQNVPNLTSAGAVVS